MTPAAFEKVLIPEIDQAIKLRQDSKSKLDAKQKKRVCRACNNNFGFEFTQYHADIPRRLEVTLFRATNLDYKSSLFQTNACVKIKHGSHTLKSRTIKENDNPVWGTNQDTFCFSYQPQEHGKNHQKISVEVYHRSTTVKTKCEYSYHKLFCNNHLMTSLHLSNISDLLGQAVIDLDQYPTLEHMFEDAEFCEPILVDLALHPPGSGHIQVGLKVIPQPT